MFIKQPTYCIIQLSSKLKGELTEMTLLLAVIYITFISLGLPDSLFGVAWPVMHIDLHTSQSFASIFMIITGGGGALSSFFSGILIRKFGTGKVTLVSVVLTACGLLGISFSGHIALVMLFSVLLGLGSGAIDSSLNNFVSLHYKAIHMNWLHCFWGVGVTTSPLVMSHFLRNADWRGGYRTIAGIQFTISLILFLTLPLWKRAQSQLPKTSSTSDPQANAPKKSALMLIKQSGVLLSIIALGLYCVMECVIGTWGGTYIVNCKALSPAVASKWVSLFFGGIMLGRFLSGIISLKVSDKYLMYGGLLFSLIGMIIMILPIGQYSLVGLLFIGTGFGPIFPSMLHIIPLRFGAEYSTDLTGFHMGGAYAFSWIFQISYGFLASATTFAFTPYLLLVVAGILFMVIKTVNKITGI